MSTTVFEVPEMSCAHCKETIEGALGKVEGVESAIVDLELRSVSVNGSADRDSLQRAIEEAGYKVTPGVTQ